MPDGVEPFLVDDEEDRADRVRDPADHQIGERKGGNYRQERLDGDQHEPPHDQVERDRKPGEPAGEDGVHRHAEERQSPDQPEESPAHRAAENREAESGIRAGD